jgi:hypothetical protein|tara:strand:- start:6094 stop:6444 length:351 start_codon:yes stop_codon:yes gene_type:complete
MNTKKEIVGLTYCTSDKTKFHGFIVRRGKKNYNFRRYVSACARHVGPGSDNARTMVARGNATIALQDLDLVLADKKSWRKHAGLLKLTKKSTLELQALGFTIVLPAPKQETGVRNP